MIAAYIKRKCDEKYGPCWQVLAGEDFKAAFTHDTKHFMCVGGAWRGVWSTARARDTAFTSTHRRFVESGKMNVVVWR